MLRRTAQVLVVEGDPSARARVCDVLRPAGYEVLEADSGEVALELVEAKRPSLVLLNVKLPGMSGYEVCRALRDEHDREIAIVFVSAERTEPYDRAAGLLVGADDYVTVPFAPQELLARVRVLSGRNNSAARGDQHELTAREREVLALLARGQSQQEISAELSISSKTVATHIQRILGKLRVHSRAQAVALAHRERLVELAD